MRLETTRLVIRSFEPSDAEKWIALVNDPEVARYTSSGTDATMETFLGMLERRRALERERGYAIWAVDLKDTGTFIGQCGLPLTKSAEPEIALTYHLDKRVWGSGYATEAATAVLAYAFGTLVIERVVALVRRENIASRRVIEKCGMRYVGSASQHGLVDLKYVAEREWWKGE